MNGRPSRIGIVVAGFVLLSTGRAASAVGDATLIIRGVHRPLGHQSATIRLVVTPAPATRSRSGRR